MSIVWINGQFKNDAEAGVSLRDSGLLHGAGVFTTMRAYGGKVFRLVQHLRRLRDSCEALFIPLQFKDDVLAKAVDELLKQNELSDARLRLTVTRGASTQDPLHGLRLDPTAFLTAAPLEPYPREFYERGMTVILLDEQKANPYDMQAGHKTVNYLSRLSALRAANQRQAGEALWFNVHNYLQSSCIANVFLVENGTLLTPPTQVDLRAPALKQTVPYPRSNVLPGVTREAVLEIAADLRIETSTPAVDVNRLLAADEIFLTNSIMGIMPVCRVELKAIGPDKPGEITLRLSEAYAQQVDDELGNEGA
ncbi:MAG TPA: aminotransferase class IV [Tepidisphaeraceae bacterium]|jgi:branched-chain amino acid aminotransferase|nr:aminotransferase class IV [Tepidisphaeraceae bacterium]